MLKNNLHKLTGFIIIFLFYSYKLYGYVDIGYLDDSSYEQFQLKLTFNTQITPVISLRDTDTTDTVYPYGEENRREENKDLIIPQFWWTLYLTIGDIETISFIIGLTFKTPPIYKDEEIKGPGVFLDFGIKTFIIKNKAETTHLYYKFNLALGYNGNPGFEILFKNSLVFNFGGFQNLNFNLIPSLLNSFIFGQSASANYYRIIKKSKTSFTLTPQLELNWTIPVLWIIYLVIGVTCYYEVNFDLQKAGYLQGTFGIILCTATSLSF